MTTTPASSPYAPSPAPSAPSRPGALDRLFQALHASPIRRSRHRAIAGVASGLAENLGVSTAIVRIAFVVTAILGPGVVLYLLAWLLLPNADDRVRLESAVRQGDAPSIALGVLTAIALVPDSFFNVHLGPLAIILLVLAVIAWTRRSRGQRAAAVPAPYSTPAPYPTPAPYLDPQAGYPAGQPVSYGPQPPVHPVPGPGYQGSYQTPQDGTRA